MGNRSGRNLATKPRYGGRATRQPVTRVKLEQASKAAMWMPTRRKIGEGRMDREEPGAGQRSHPNQTAPIRSTGVMSTAWREGNLSQWGRPGMVGESRTRTASERMPDYLGVGKGQRYR